VSDHPIDPAIQDLIRIKAARIARSRHVPNADREDIEQALMLDVLRRLPKFDPSKGDREDHLRAVVEHAVSNLIRSGRAAKRGRGRTAPLDSIPVDEPQLGHTDEDLAQADLVLDIQELLGRLPAELRRLAKLLQTQTPTEIARALGLSRGTVYARIREIRTLCEKSELVNYLATSSDTSRADGVVP
jgi:RNA polymerase sigma-70 factor (ECF subfamily)